MVIINIYDAVSDTSAKMTAFILSKVNVFDPVFDNSTYYKVWNVLKIENSRYCPNISILRRDFQINLKIDNVA